MAFFGGNLGFNKQIGGLNLGVNIPFGDQGGNKTKVGDDGKTPENSQNRIIQHVNESGGHSKPALYKVEITPPTSLDKWLADKQSMKHISFNCDSVNVPGRNISTKPFKTYGLKKEMVYDKIHAEMETTFYVSESLEEVEFFEDWTDLMYNANGTIGWYNDYALGGTVVIKQLSNKAARGGKEDLGTIAEWKLHEAYPKTVSALQLGYANGSTIQKISVSFAFRDLSVDYPQSTKRISENSTAGLLVQKSSFLDNIRIGGINIPLGRGFSISSVANRNRSIFR